MVLTFSLTALKVLVKLCYFFGLVPYFWSEKTHSFKQTLRVKKIQRWKIQITILLIIYSFSTLQYGYLVINQKESMYFLLLSGFPASVYFTGVYLALHSFENSKTFCQLSFVILRKTHSDGNKRQLMSAEWWLVSIVMFLVNISGPVVAVMSIAFPCRQVSSRTIAYFYPKSCSSKNFQFICSLLEFSLFQATAILWGIQVLMLCVAIQKWNRKLSTLQKVCCTASQSTTDSNKQLKAIQDFKTHQVFTALLNSFCKLYILPAIQINCTFFSIAGMYVALVSTQDIPPTLYFITVMMGIGTKLFGLLLLDFTSKGLVCSKGFLLDLKKSPLFIKSPLFRRYVRCLPILKIYMGPFHPVDRSRAPAFLKFCLQRTIFLVVKSRM